MITTEQILEREKYYAELMQDDPRCKLAFWTTWANDVRAALPKFRGDKIYLSQDLPKENYLNAYEYAVRNDALNLYSIFTDDDSYGNSGYTMCDRFITRDLLDSVLEINFLAKHLGWTAESSPVILDIGAGYGRFAKRVTEATMGECYCTDAVPLSMAICDLNTENADCVAPILPKEVGENDYDLAVNIHSWSESPAASVREWLKMLVAMKVPNLFLVTHPNQNNRTWDGADLVMLCAEYGYALKVASNKFAPTHDEQNRIFVYDAPYLLFKLEVAQ